MPVKGALFAELLGGGVGRLKKRGAEGSKPGAGPKGSRTEELRRKAEEEDARKREMREAAMRLRAEEREREEDEQREEAERKRLLEEALEAAPPLVREAMQKSESEKQVRTWASRAL